MIGGSDHVFAVPRDAISIALGSIATVWTHAVVQGANGGVYSSPFDVPEAEYGELFVFESRAALDDWDAHGARAQNAHQMIHLIWSAQRITVVVESRDEAAAKRVLQELRTLQIAAPRLGIAA